MRRCRREERRVAKRDNHRQGPQRRASWVLERSSERMCESPKPALAAYGGAESQSRCLFFLISKKCHQRAATCVYAHDDPLVGSSEDARGGIMTIQIS